MKNRMEEVGKWEGRYTKHVKQKRKVYHDGYLHLLPSNNKVMLYDESEKLLDTTFLNNRECLQPGESIAFPSFLVDIGDPLLSDTSINTFPNKRPSFIPRNTSSNNLSPSHKIIREFKKNEAVKFTTHHFPSSVAASSSKEWEALYTTQITQKAKKYHDGFIRLIICGSRGRQVALFDSSKTQIDKRFLKKDEVICCGESLNFDGHLVEIGDSLGNNGNDVRVKTVASNCISDEVERGGQWHQSCNENLMYNPKRCRIPTRQNHLLTDTAISIGQSQNYVGSSKFLHSSFDGLRVDQMKLTKTPLSRMPPRDVHHILSSLKKPTTGGNDTILGKAAAKPFEGIAQLDPLQANNATTHLKGIAQLDPLQANNVTTQLDHEEALANTCCSSGNIEKPDYARESPNKSKFQQSFIPQQPVHAGFTSIISPGTQPTRSTHQQPCDKSLETNASSEGNASSISNKPKVRRVFGGLSGIKMMRSNANTAFPVETLDCPSFDLGI